MRARILILLLLAAVASGCGSEEDLPRAEPPPQGLALEVEHLTSGPLYALYRDGRLFSPAPQIAIYPGPALPAFTVTRVQPERADEILEGLERSGVLQDGDSPPPAGENDLLVTALLGGELRTVRVGGERAQAVLDLLADLPVASSDALYEPEALAVIAAPPEPAYEEPDVRDWPLGDLPDGCSVITGEELEPVLTAAAQANQLTRWRTTGGELVGARFRPLLPHEESCADLADLPA